MAHHKRRRAKHQRAGCLMCKPWKDERGKSLTANSNGRGPRISVKRQLDAYAIE